MRRPHLPAALVAGLLAAAATGAWIAAGAPIPSADAREGGRADVASMDVGLLRESLLKLWIIEESSSRHNQSRIAQKSFEGLTAPESTGNAELDRQNVEAKKKLAKELRHYLLLELDGAIEAVDICDRVLGTKATLDAATLDRRLFFQQKLPVIQWRGVLLQDALADLGRITGTPVDLHPAIPKNLTLEVSFEGPAGFTLEGVLEFLREQHPMEWKYEGGRLDVTYTGEMPKGFGQR